MSAEELVNAYVEGRVSRRTLIRRLTAAGMSMGAAVSYAHLLTPERAVARLGNGGHFDLEGSILNEPLQKVISRERVRVKVKTTDAINIFVRVRLLRPNSPFPVATIADMRLTTFGPVVATLTVPLDYNPPHSVNALKGRKRAKLALVGSGVQTSPSVQTSDYEFGETVLRRK
jgi:hypothetical protein